MNGIDSTHLDPKKVAELAEILVTDSANYWKHEPVPMLHPSGEPLLDRFFYREMPTRTTSHTSETSTKVSDVSDGSIGEKSFQESLDNPSALLAIKAEFPEFDKMMERTKVLASGLKALEKQHSEASAMQAKFEAKSVADGSFKKPAKDLKDVLGTLGNLISDIRSKLAIAECISKGDEVGTLPADIEKMISQADTNLDGIKAMKKRLSASFVPPPPSNPWGQ